MWHNIFQVQYIFLLEVAHFGFVVSPFGIRWHHSENLCHQLEKVVSNLEKPVSISKNYCHHFSKSGRSGLKAVDVVSRWHNIFQAQYIFQLEVAHFDFVVSPFGIRWHHSEFGCHCLIKVRHASGKIRSDHENSAFSFQKITIAIFPRVGTLGFRPRQTQIIFILLKLPLHILKWWEG